MKIEKIGSKSDLVSNLKKAAQLSNIRQLELLGEYIRQEKDLKNLKEGLVVQEYEVKLVNQGYEILLITSQFDGVKNTWNVKHSEVVEKISFAELEQMEEKNRGKTK